MMNKKLNKGIALILIAGLLAPSALGGCGKNDSTEMTEATEIIATEGLATETTEAEEVTEQCYIPADGLTFYEGYELTEDENTVYLDEEDTSVAGQYCILVNEETGQVLVNRSANEKMYPASMTKVLTLLVAVEICENLDSDLVVPEEAVLYAYQNDCSSAWLQTGDVFTVRDLLYMTILPSGGDAAMTLAIDLAGSMDAFVELMNQKVEELGISETSHFTNPVGIYDENNYTTAADMSVIMKAAIENETCRDVLGRHFFNHTATQNHTDGLFYSNLFLRRIEDKITTGTVLGAKTGFVNQSGSCAVSYEVSNTGVPYICVVGSSYSSHGCVNDHVTLYDTYAK